MALRIHQVHQRGDILTTNVERFRGQKARVRAEMEGMKDYLKERGDLYYANRSLVYVAGPFRPNADRTVIQNIDSAEHLAKRIWEQGHYVFCPHANSGFMYGYLDEAGFLEADLFILSLCDAVICTKGWEHSAGTLAELELASELNIPRLESPDDLPSVPWPSMESYGAKRSTKLLTWRADGEW